MSTDNSHSVKPNWWTTLPGLLTAFGGVIAAIAGLVTALASAGIIGANSRSTSSASQALEPSVAHETEISDPNSDPRIDAPMMGVTGWIYVGSRVHDQWKTTHEEGIEPARTLKSDGIPVRGMIYVVERGVNIRKTLPTSQNPGERPQMTESKGTIDSTYRVKVDDVREILLTNPSRTWVWAHITVSGRN